MLGRIRCQLPSVIDTSLLHSRSRLYTPELVALSVELSQNMSYGKVAAILNRVQHRPNTLAFNKMTIDNTVVSWGSLIHQEQLNQAKQALLDFGFDPETGKVQPGVSDLSNKPNYSRGCKVSSHGRIYKSAHRI